MAGMLSGVPVFTGVFLLVVLELVVNICSQHVVKLLTVNWLRPLDCSKSCHQICRTLIIIL